MTDNTSPWDGKGNEFALLFRKSPLGMIVSAPDRLILDINDAAVDLLGFAREEAVGRTTMELAIIDPEPQQRLGALLGVHGSVHDAEVALKPKSGSPRNVLVSIEPIEMAAGRRYVSTFVDVTERKKLEDTSREIIETMREGVAIADAGGRYTFVNGPILKMLGFEANEILGKTLYDFVAPEDRSVAEANIARRRSGIAEDRQLKVRRKDGSSIWVAVSSTPLKAQEDGHSVLLMVRDVTEQKRQEDRLRVLQHLVDSVTDYAIFVLDPTGHVATWSPGAQRIKGYEAAEIQGKHFSVFYTPEDRDAGHPEEILETLYRTGRFEEEGWRVRKNGERFWASIVITALRDGTGQITGLAKLTRDRTEQREAQARLALSDRLLSVGTLAAGVAHEINNPLAVVMANMELLAEDLHEIGGASPSARLRSMLETVSGARDGAERVRNIVRGMKIFSRPNDAQPQLLELPHLLEVAVNMSFHEVRQKARLVRDYAPTPLVLADEARLVQVFINLIVNAAHAIPEGAVEKNEIRLVTRSQGTQVIVEVQDTGSGIPPEVVGKIFDPFFTTKPVGVGTGLGLSIIHGILGGLGGTIAVTSRVGVGTTMRVELPAAPPATPRTTASL
jgi:two-component system cell cycle sensor histidine kinase/response regulator CckA